MGEVAPLGNTVRCKEAGGPAVQQQQKQQKQAERVCACVRSHSLRQEICTRYGFVVQAFSSRSDRPSAWFIKEKERFYQITTGYIGLIIV